MRQGVFFRSIRLPCQDLGEGDLFEEAEGIVPGEALALGGGTADAAEEARQLTGGAQSGVPFLAQGLDEGEVLKGDFSRSGPRQGRRGGATAAVAVTAGWDGFAEMAGDEAGDAVVGFGKFDDLPDPYEVGLFALMEALIEAVGDVAGTDVIAEQAVSLADSAAFHGDITGLVEMAEGGGDALTGFPGLCGDEV